MANSLRLALALLAAVGATSCKVDNQDFCCVTDCEAHGASGPVACPSPLMCDATRFACYDPTNGGTCQRPEDCAGTMTPYCVQNKCVQCQDSSTGCTAQDPVCSPDNACAGCTQNQDCSAYTASGTPHCGSGGACVGCRDPNDCTDANAPVCDQNACRACESDDDCASGACDKDTGACGSESSVIYLSPTGVSTGTCTKTSPCNTFALGLAQVGGVRNVIHAAPGDYSGQIVLSHITVTIYGDGATLTANTTGQSVIAVGDGADITIQGLHVTGAGGTGHPPGVTCATTTTPAKMRLHRMRIDGNDGGGVSSFKCGFELINNFIVMNGGLASTFGGVSIPSTNATDIGVLDFNTIAGNTGMGGSVTGVQCNGIAKPLTFGSNIIYDNQVSNGGKQVDSNCSYQYSDVNDTTNGTGNITGAPGFVDAGGGNYHVGAGSAVDAADPASTLGIDFDGDARPKGPRRDIGADEAM